MKQTKYFCNLCNEEKKPTDLLCMYYDSAKITTNKTGENKFGGYTIVTDVTKSDKHICKDCFNLIYDFTKHYQDVIKS